MDDTESEFFAKAKPENDPAAPRTNWTIPILAGVVAVGAIILWRVLVQPPPAPVTATEPAPTPVVKAPDTETHTFSAPPSVERPEKPPAPPKDFGN